MGIDALKAVVSRESGFAFANRVNVYAPGRIAEKDLMSASVTTLNLPERQLMTQTYQQQSQLKTIINGFSHNNLTLTFRVTNGWSLYTAFDNWSNYIIGEDTYQMNYKDTYGGDVIIAPLDQAGNETCKFTLHNAFPTVVGQIQMGNEMENQIVTFSVEIAYDKFDYEPTDF